MKYRNLQKLELPREVYKYPKGANQIIEEQEMVIPVLKLDWTESVILTYEGAEYPQKVMTEPEALWLTNLTKRNILNVVKLLTHKYLLPAYLVILFLPFKKKIKFMEFVLTCITDTVWKNMSPAILKDKHMSPVAQEIAWATYTFLTNLGINNKTSDRFAEVFSASIDYDSAYRYRVQDLFSATTKTELLKNPRKEVNRLIKLSVERDDQVVSSKFIRFGSLLTLALLHPKIKKVFKIAISEIDVRKASFDEADRYWAYQRTDYKYDGLTREEMEEKLKGKSKPVLIKRKNI